MIKKKEKDYFLNNSKYVFNYFENKNKIDKTIDMLGGSHFENMGDQFLNISFYSI